MERMQITLVHLEDKKFIIVVLPSGVFGQLTFTYQQNLDQLFLQLIWGPDKTGGTLRPCCSDGGGGRYERAVWTLMLV